MLTNNEQALNKVYNVAVGDRFSVNYLYETCKNHLSSDWEATYREPRSGDIRHSQADISLAKNLLNYQPTKNFEAGLIDTINYFKSVYTN